MVEAYLALFTSELSKTKLQVIYENERRVDKKVGHNFLT